MNKMSVEEAMNGKCIREPDVQPQQLPEKEFTELSVDDNDKMLLMIRLIKRLPWLGSKGVLKTFVTGC